MLLLITCITTSTYAWFQMNNDAFVSDFDFGFDTDEGIFISIDDVNYKENINNEDLIKAIVKEGFDYSYNDKGKLVDDLGNVIDNNKLLGLFNQIKLNPVTSLDGISFNDYYGVEKKATSLEYYSFEIYVKLFDSTVSTPNSLDVVFKEETSIKSDSVDYLYYNDFYTYDKNTFVKVAHSPKIINETDEAGSTISKRPTILVNAVDAVRFSTTSNDNTKIYELSEGLGSYATDLDSDLEENKELAKYDANKNAGFTLLNASLSKPLNKMRYTDMPKTYKNITDAEAKVLTTLNKETSYKTKVKINFWLEGYDADCFNGIGKSKITTKFTFGIE